MESETMECDTTSPELDPQLADQCKVEGNTAYTQKDYNKAVECYSKAISHNPNNASYYGNRAAALMMLEKYMSALEDAVKSTQLDEDFVKGYLRAAKCHLMLGNPSLSVDFYNKVLTLQPKNTQAIQERAISLEVGQHLERSHLSYDKQDYRQCLYHLDQCLSASPFCVAFKTLKAEALAMSRRLDEATMLCNELLMKNVHNYDAIYVKALCHYYQDDTEKAHQLLQRVLRQAPDHAKAMLVIKNSRQLIKQKEAGNAAYKRGSYREAYDIYSEALTIDPINIITNAKLYCNRALMAQKLGLIEEAIADCNSAIGLDERYIRAYQRRAKLYQQNEQHQECVNDWKKVCEMEGNRENRQELKDAERQLKLSKRKDYYKILGTDKSASQADIKKAYRKQAMLHHPDRHASAEQEVKEKEEQIFKEISEAYSVLSDERKKERYDNGQDLDELGMDVNPSDLFSTMFGGEMPFGFAGSTFGSGGSGGGARTFTFNMGGGPGFSFPF